MRQIVPIIRPAVSATIVFTDNAHYGGGDIFNNSWYRIFCYCRIFDFVSLGCRRRANRLSPTTQRINRLTPYS
ncbi:hypothetical protein D3C71_1859390 [compost metagenome]